MNIIPLPQSIKSGKGHFYLNNKSRIISKTGDLEQDYITSYLVSQIYEYTGLSVLISGDSESDPSNIISLELLDNQVEIGNEGYCLSIGENQVKISAHKPAGIFYGVQTFIQLICKDNGEILIPECEIIDYPRFQYRGMMLDVARHFFGVDDVKRLIDLLVLYKINFLHLHLTDDQGWRIQIDSWPKLTEIGGSTSVGGGTGGYYSKDDFKEIVVYAAKNFITVIPEIDLPGHTNAALASYPELNKDGVVPELYTGIEVGFSSLCVEKEKTFKFIDDVICEIAEITPGSYIHIGGDEAKSTSTEDYQKFIQYIESVIQKYGKKMIGWQEIVKADSLGENSIVQYWNHIDEDFQLSKDNSLIMSPANKTYLDMRYNRKTKMGLKWAGYVSVKDAYDWEPTDELEGVKENQVFGVEAPLWSEMLHTIKDIEFMTFPRLIGIAEIGWSSKDGRNWEEYKVRLASHEEILTGKSINFYKSKLIDW